MQRILVEEGTRAILRYMAACAALFVEPSEERVLTLAALHYLCRAAMIQVRALMPNTGESVITALANGPHDHAH